MLWIALYLPRLPLDLAYRRWPEAMREGLEHGVPLAVTEARRIRWANACAQQAGVEFGMRESSARSRASELVLLERDIDAEARAVIETALWALHFTPQVSLQDQGLLLEVAPSLRLFGGLDAVKRGLREGVQRLGFVPQLASAPTATAAWLLAQHMDDIDTDGDTCAAKLDALPVNLMQTAQRHLDSLHAIGCRSLAQLRALPRGGITRRFGAAVLSELDKAYGTEPDARAWYEAPETFAARLELMARVDSTEALQHAAERLLLQMTGWLVARHAAITRFSLLLHHESVRKSGNAPSMVEVRLGSASRDLAHLALLLQENLAKLVLRASVIELTLQADTIEPLAAPNNELFASTACRAESMARLIERLTSRLGEEAVRRFVLVADHRPERSFALKPAMDNDAGRERGQQELVEAFPPRPGWLLAEPLALMVRGEKPFYLGSLTMLSGPERIESGWWDDKLAARDYFIASNESRMLLWIYRERPSLAEETPGWFLHGFFG
ncbi:MAG TPA: DNA polymerase Y family protein [Burkholderiaceae bacterium]